MELTRSASMLGSGLKYYLKIRLRSDKRWLLHRLPPCSVLGWDRTEILVPLRLKVVAVDVILDGVPKGAVLAVVVAVLGGSPGLIVYDRVAWEW